MKTPEELKKSLELAKAKIIDLKSRKVLADLPTEKPKTEESHLLTVGSVKVFHRPSSSMEHTGDNDVHLLNPSHSEIGQAFHHANETKKYNIFIHGKKPEQTHLEQAKQMYHDLSRKKDLEKAQIVELKSKKVLANLPSVETSKEGVPVLEDGKKKIATKTYVKETFQPSKPNTVPQFKKSDDEAPAASKRYPNSKRKLSAGDISQLDGLFHAQNRMGRDHKDWTPTQDKIDALLGTPGRPELKKGLSLLQQKELKKSEDDGSDLGFAHIGKLHEKPIDLMWASGLHGPKSPIGITRSGRAIHKEFSHPEHSSFDGEDHFDASHIHEMRQYGLGQHGNRFGAMESDGNLHRMHGQSHIEAASKIDPSIGSRATHDVNWENLKKSEELKKSEDEVIGQTKSGKSVYGTHSHPSHKEFSEQDHDDAMEVHQSKIKELRRLPRTEEIGAKIKHYREQGSEHNDRRYEALRRRLPLKDMKKSEDLAKGKVISMQSRKVISDDTPKDAPKIEAPKEQEPDHVSGFPGFKSLTVARYGTPSGNIWVSEATKHNGEKTHGTHAERDGARHMAAYGGHKGESKDAMHLLDNKSPAHKMVAANSYLRQHVPSLALQHKDLHLLHHASEGEHHVGVVSIDRRSADVEPRYHSYKHKNIKAAVHGALEEALLDHHKSGLGAIEDSTTPRAANPNQAKKNAWLTHWIHKQPKISLKDVLHMPAKDDVKKSTRGWSLEKADFINTGASREDRQRQEAEILKIKRAETPSPVPVVRPQTLKKSLQDQKDLEDLKKK